MANLKDLLVKGPSSLIGDVTVNKIRLTSLKAPTASSGSIYGFGSSGQILKTNGSSVYWADDVVSKLGTTTVGSSSQPIYLNNGTPLAITCLKVEAGGTGKDSRRKAGLFYNWTASLQGQTWSRICKIPCTSSVIGSTMILNIRHTRANVVYNETVMITVHHNSKGNITSLSSSNYNQSSTVQIRAVANSSGDCYIELKDSNAGIGVGTAISSVYCALQIISLGNDEPTLETSFKNGTTLPENFSVAAEVTLGRNRIITSGIFSGDLEGNATTASGISSPEGTTAKFWRGDNYWSNILTQTQTQDSAALFTDNSKIGTAIKTLHIATAGSATGIGLNDGVVAGLTFGVSSGAQTGAAYAGIYYQASNSYGSRLYFATTQSFGYGAYARMVIRQDGKVGIGTMEPQELLEINGNICANNIYPKNSNNDNNYSSYDLGKTNARWNKLYVSEFAPDEEYSISITFSNGWQDLKNSSNEQLIHLSKSGTYIVQIYDNSHPKGASNHWDTYWSGIFSWYAGAVNGSGEYTEIPLHGSGHAMNQKSIQLRTYSPPQPSNMKFQIKGNRSTSTNSAENTISIKFKFIM